MTKQVAYLRLSARWQVRDDGIEGRLCGHLVRRRASGSAGHAHSTWRGPSAGKGSHGAAPGSVITGIVIDENGEPSPGTPVRAYRYVLRTGERSLQQVGQDTTDDRRVYRIFQLQPGDYVVSAVPRNFGIADARDAVLSDIQATLQQAQAAGATGGGGPGGRGGLAGLDLGTLVAQPAAQQLLARAQQLQQQLAQTEQEQAVAYAPCLYPGTTSASGAATVALGVGEERSNVDFQLQLVPTARVEGVVMSSDGALPQGTQVALVPTERMTTQGLAGLATTTSRVGPGRHVLVSWSHARTVLASGARDSARRHGRTRPTRRAEVVGSASGGEPGSVPVAAAAVASDRPDRAARCSGRRWMSQ